VETIPEKSNNLVMKKLLSTAEQHNSISMVWVEIDGSHRAIRTHSKERIYYILEGSFTFRIGEEENIILATNDIIVLPCLSTYSFQGVGKYLVMNIPAFKDGDDEYVEM
jgi:mannose-6-phosphate isomerase-like protein (cupin superfamily)